MTEAVQVFFETGSLGDVTAVHRFIAGTYQDDFSEYTNAEVDYYRLPIIYPATKAGKNSGADVGFRHATDFIKGGQKRNKILKKDDSTADIK